MKGSVTAGVTEFLQRGPSSAAELCRALDVSQSWLSRTLQPLEAAGRVVRFGSTKGARYGLARAIGTIGSQWPLYRIDQAGTPTELGTLFAIERDRYYNRGGPPRVAGLADALPYFLRDARPAGFLGRAIPSAHADLALPPRVQDWTDEHVLTFLALRGSETVGDLILGQVALDRYLAGQQGPQIVNEKERSARYPQLADQAMEGAPPGSSAHGENPKFSVRVARGRDLTHVLVKFSPSRNSQAGERWADLLTAEFLASRFLDTHGIAAARSHLFEFEDRVFLESERFDRIGADGRRGVASLLAVDTLLYGQLDRWAACASRLQRDNLLSAQDAQRLALLDAFGSLIANSDRHFGNVTLLDSREGPFGMAPVYDMLPMLFAPADGHLVEREFNPEGQRAETLAVWPQALELAIGYWTQLSEDERLTSAFRAIARNCLTGVQQLRGGGRRTA